MKVADDKIIELFKKICSIMDVSYQDMLTNKKYNFALVRVMCVHFATIRLSASLTDLHRVMGHTVRNITKMRAKAREGIEREQYYREPYELIKKGLSE